MKMYMRLLSILYLFLISTFFGYSQEVPPIEKNTSEIVFLKSISLKKVIKKIITEKDNNCNEKDANWYLEFKKEDLIIVSKNRIRNLVNSNTIDKFYTTTIDNNIVFLLNSDKSDFFDKTGYSIDLTPFTHTIDYSTVEYSFWVMKKTGNEKYKIIKVKKYKCN